MCSAIGSVKKVQPLWKTVWKFLKELKIELPHDPAIPPLGIDPEELKAESQRHTHTYIYTPMFTAVFFTIAKKWKQPKWPSMDE